MSDSYIAEMITEELRRSCHGPTACHGCISWCPACGPTSHVCDDPECDTHRREIDVKRDMEEAEEKVAKTVALCIRREEELLAREERASDVGWTRMELRRAVRDHDLAERELGELGDELEGMRAPWANLVPRRPGDTKRR